MKLLIQLNGGLGNQMFQYVFGKKLEKKYKCEIFFQHNNHGNRKYMLDIFGITEKKFPPNLITNKIVYKGSYNNDNVLNYNNLNENENYYIDGYFQHTDYFSEIIDDVYNMFKLESPIKIDDEYVVIQIRRTDYVYSKIHFVCDKNWYLKALENFKDIKKIIFISDDLMWCKNNFNDLSKELFFLDLNEKETLGFLQHSKNIIISNSTFGWWGAWLSKSKNVIQPKTWLNNDSSWELGCPFWMTI
jgi:hypothetical protein